MNAVAELVETIGSEAMLTFATNWKGKDKTYEQWHKDKETPFLTQRNILNNIRYWDAQVNRAVIGPKWSEPKYREHRLQMILVLEHVDSNVHGHGAFRRPRNKSGDYPSWDELKAICPWRSITKSGDVNWRIYSEITDEHSENAQRYSIKEATKYWNLDKLIYSPVYDVVL
jgi:hypothetical protein